MNRIFRLAILVSGRGSNLHALIQAQQTGTINTQIVGVFSDKPECGAIALAEKQHLFVFAQRAKDFASREAFDDALFNAIAAVQPDLIICAGYMRIISECAVRRFQERMINIHPSLLPKYPGLDTHARVLAARDAEHGASVHVVIPALDAGPVLAQVRVATLPEDTPESLANRVLSREHVLLVQCVKAISEGGIQLNANGITWRGNSLAAPLTLNKYDCLEETQS